MLEQQRLPDDAGPSPSSSPEAESTAAVGKAR
jgi:hypothetical protein